MNVFFALGGLLANLFALHFKHYKDFLYLYFISMFLVSVGYFYILPSPFHLFRKKQLSKLYNCIQTICKRNFSGEQLTKKELEVNQFFEQNMLSVTKNPTIDPEDKQKVFSSIETQIKQEEKLISKSAAIKEQSFKSSILDFCSKKNLATFFKLIFLFILIDLVFGLAMVINKDLGISNIYYSGMLVTSFQASGYVLATFILSRFGRRHINIFITSLVTVASIAIFVIDIVSKQFSAYSDRSHFVKLAETGGVY